MPRRLLIPNLVALSLALLLNLHAAIWTGSIISLISVVLTASGMCYLCIRSRRLRERRERIQAIRLQAYYEQVLQDIHVLRDFAPSAMERAEELFRASLTPQQKEQWETWKVFVVQGSDGQEYSLEPGFAYNVITKSCEYLGYSMVQYCAGPDGIPSYDRLLAQKLLIETDVNQFKKIAHKYPLDPTHRRGACLLH